jgi:hypothetical protein
MADTLRFDGLTFGSAGPFTIQDSSPTALGPDVVSAGAFNITDTSGATIPAGTSFMAWCLTAFTALTTTNSYTLRSGETFYAPPNAHMATDLRRLASFVFANTSQMFTNLGFAGGANSTTQSSAFQLATWEIINDNAGTGGYNVEAGDFRVVGGDGTARALANNWLSVVNTGTHAIDQELAVWEQDCRNGNCTQNLAVFTPMVPEPETYAMLLAGLGLMAFVARRRKMK